MNIILREINKAYLGFAGSDYISEEHSKLNIATGKWYFY